MKRHPLDILSLLMGAVFLLVALAYVVGDLTDAMPSALITMPLMLAGLGIAGLAGAFAAMQRADERAAQAATDSALEATSAQTDWSGTPYPGEAVSAPDTLMTTAPTAVVDQHTPTAAQDTVVFPAEGAVERDT